MFTRNIHFKKPNEILRFFFFTNITVNVPLYACIIYSNLISVNVGVLSTYFHSVALIIRKKLINNQIDFHQSKNDVFYGRYV